MDENSSFQCFCGETVGVREELVEHNISAHEMVEDESRRAVDEKYPRMA